MPDEADAAANAAKELEVSTAQTAASLEAIVRSHLAITDSQALQLQHARSYSELLSVADKSYRQITDLSSKVAENERRTALQLRSQVSDAAERLRSVQKYFDAYGAYTQKLREEEELTKNSIQLAGDKLGYTKEETAEVIKRYETLRNIEKLSTVLSAVRSAGSAAGTLVDINFQSQMEALRGRTMGAMQGAGMSPSGTGEGVALSSKLFGSVGNAMGPDQRLEATIKVLNALPKAADESSESMTTMIDTLGFVGLSMDEIIAAQIKGGREAGLSADEISRSYTVAGRISKNFGLNAKEVGDNLLNLTTSIRAAGGTAGQAQAIFMALDKDINILGRSMTGVEKIKLGESFAGVFNLSISKMIGLTSMAQNKPIESIREGDLTDGAIVGSVKTIWDRMSSNIGSSYAQQVIMAEQLGQLVGFDTSTAAKTVGIYELMKSSATSQDFMAKALDRTDLKPPAERTAAGIETIRKSVEPLAEINNTVKDIKALMSPIGNLLGGLSNTLGAGRVVGEVVSTGVAARAAAPVLRAGAGWLLGEGTAVALGTGAAALTGPVAIGAGIVTGLGLVGYGAYKDYEESQHNRTR